MPVKHKSWTNLVRQGEAFKFFIYYVANDLKIEGRTLWWRKKNINKISQCQKTERETLWNFSTSTVTVRFRTGLRLFKDRPWSRTWMHRNVCENVFRLFKHRRDGMSRLGTSRNVQWSAEGARKCVYPRCQNLVNVSSLRSRKFR